MHTRIVWINLFLSCLIVLTLFMLFQVLTDDGVVNPTTPSRQAKEGEWPQILVSRRVLDTASSFTSIRENNLFSRNRQARLSSMPVVNKPEIETSKEPEPLKELPEKDIHLNGIILADTFKAAFVKNPSQDAGAPAQIRVGIGDAVGRYIVKEIQREAIVLEADSQQYEVRLFEKKDRETQAGSTKTTIEPKIVTAGSEDISPQKEKEEPAPKEEAGFEWFNTPFGKVKRLIKK